MSHTRVTTGSFSCLMYCTDIWELGFRSNLKKPLARLVILALPQVGWKTLKSISDVRSEYEPRTSGLVNQALNH